MDAKRITKILLGFAIISCFSCVSAFNPLYTKSTIYFDPGLIARYENDVTLEKGADDTSYNWINRDEKGLVKNKLPVHFIKLGDDYFVDIESPGNGKMPTMHAIDRVTFEGHNIIFWTFEDDSSRIHDHSEDDPDHPIKMNPFYDRDEVDAGEFRGEDGHKDRAMTFTTDKLQEFFKNHAREMTYKELKLIRADDAH